MEANMNSSISELNLNEMEMINGGWNWKKCLFGGAVGAVAGGAIGARVGAVPGAIIGGVIGATGGLAD